VEYAQANETAAVPPRFHEIRRRSRRLLDDPLAPIVVLCLILVFSLYARVIDLGEPCTSPCHTVASHTLVFDEVYYVNAARVIDGINPPAGAPYHNAPKGDDPNAEHPQLAKVIMAGFIELFGDNPQGWRMGSVLFGLIALVALYALVRAAGGSQWLAVGASTVMSLDNLLLVHGRIGTLDIYALAMMLLAATLYLRRWPLAAGLALGVAACMKEVALYLLFVIAALELMRVARARFRDGSPAGWFALAARPLLLFVLSSAVSFLGLLWLLDVLVPAWDPNSHTTYAGNPIAHLSHIYHYALLLKTRPDAVGIASSPWQWLLDQKVINYAKVAVNTSSHGHLLSSRTITSFRGEINPFVIFLAVPALFAAAADAWRKADPLATIGVCWCLGTFLPFVIESQISGRITYLYYMVIVMPGIYLVLCKAFSRLSWAAILGWGVMLSYGFVELFPIRTLL
jgi:predicted membrane-bound dolichyl-phosphate-mannose-protein mannosyltransferase